MRTKKGFGKIALITVMLLAVLFAFSSCMAEPEKMTVNVRIEGIDKCLYNNEVKMPDSDTQTNTLTIKDVMEYLASQESSIIIKGLDAQQPYITQINGEAAGSFGSYEGCYDGWCYSVNGKDPGEAIDKVILKHNDNVVFYYGDPFGIFGMQIPEADISNIKDGVIKFTSLDTVYDPVTYEPTTAVNPVKGATITWHYGDSKAEYTTDDNGEIKITEDEQLKAGDHKLQIEKIEAETKLPLVLRFSDNFAVEIK